MSTPDETMSRIGQGMELSQRGERAAARQLFAEVWSDIGGESGIPLHRCALAHSMADVQDEVRDELVWDLKALEAADLITDERAAQAGVAALGGDGYGRMIRGGLDRLDERLRSSDR